MSALAGELELSGIPLPQGGNFGATIVFESNEWPEYKINEFFAPEMSIFCDQILSVN